MFLKWDTNELLELEEKELLPWTSLWGSKGDCVVGGTKGLEKGLEVGIVRQGDGKWKTGMMSDMEELVLLAREVSVAITRW